ncbi:HpcH/HpaI aldolase family protein [Natronohydrobacter thiooxidans]|uniref:HpcH/HpaI aldolase family protein n=1 Tax=Natronohydrobacter thiooxidans TaxID=87172 RepID=UPI0008FF1B5B|nr:aldolase/citrate lyase family protein [Natronohydrobacter thiooxidans]
MAHKRNFRARFLLGEVMYGTFLKVPATMPAEVMGSIGYDFVVIDEEHSPFNRETTDRIVLACRAWGIGAIVRVQSPDPATILSVLDCGADGILVPHVTDAATARAIVAAGRYHGGNRGFAPTTRAGGFGQTGQDEHIRSEDQRVAIIAMIEDPEALENIDEILEVEGLDGVFIGRGDLSAAFSRETDSAAKVREATEIVQAAATKAGRTVAVLPGSCDDAAMLAKAGASVFILSSDQGFIRSAAMRAHSIMSDAIKQARKY